MMESGRCRPWPEPHAGTLQSVCLAGCSLSVIPTHRCSHCVQAVQVPGLGPRPTGSGIAGVRALLDLELGCSLWSCGSAGKAWNSCSVSPPFLSGHCQNILPWRNMLSALGSESPHGERQ